MVWDKEQEGDLMDKTIREQLETIRRSGETNMLDVNRVQQIADREGFYELVIFIEEHRSEYINFIFYGDADDEETTDRIENAEETVSLPETTQETVQYHYNLTGQKRKELVEAISKILDAPAIYQKAPTFSYHIGGYIVDRNGTLSYTSEISPVEVQKLIARLQEQGFLAEDTDDTGNVVNSQNEEEPITVEEDEEETVAETEKAEMTVAQTENVSEIPETPKDSGGVGGLENVNVTKDDSERPESLTVEIPRNMLTDVAYINFQKIIASRATLLKQALETDTLEIKETDDRLCFPWFTLHGLEGEADAYIRLITAMVEMARRQKRVVATEKPLENAKFTMRIFLIRLGFIGNEYKTARKILLRNLTGNSSWRYGKPPKKPATQDISSFPPNPQDASSIVPDNTFSDLELNTTNTETNIPENKEVPEDVYSDHSDTFPEDKGGVPYDK